MTTLYPDKYYCILLQDWADSCGAAAAAEDVSAAVMVAATAAEPEGAVVMATAAVATVGAVAASTRVNADIAKQHTRYGSVHGRNQSGIGPISEIDKYVARINPGLSRYLVFTRCCNGTDSTMEQALDFFTNTLYRRGTNVEHTCPATPQSLHFLSTGALPFFRGP